MTHLSHLTQRRSKQTHKALEKLGRALDPDIADELSCCFAIRAVLPHKRKTQEWDIFSHRAKKKGEIRWVCFKAEEQIMTVRLSQGSDGKIEAQIWMQSQRSWNFPVPHERTPAVLQGAPDLHTSTGPHCQTIKHTQQSYLNINSYSKLQLKNAAGHSSYFLMPLRPRPYSLFSI